MNTAHIDIIDVCNLKCPTCTKGVRNLPNSGRKMPFAMFEQIIKKLKDEGYDRVDLFNWTEPFLNKTLHEYVAAVRGLDLGCGLSTTLSLPKINNLEETLVAGLDTILVSMSGLDQETYEINHVGGRLEYVFANLDRIRAIKDQHGLDLRIRVKLIKFSYNAHQESQFRSYAMDRGYEFEVVEGVGDPLNGSFASYDEGYFQNEISKANEVITSPEDRGEACPLLFDQIVIDCAGEVYLCCAMPNYASLRIGPYLQLTADEILLRRYTHSFCRVCTMPRRQANASDQQRLVRAITEADRAPADKSHPGLDVTYSSKLVHIQRANP
jgi:organic radical activating enzyme